MELNFEKMARRFIIGSSELDRMRREVQTLVEGFVGLVSLMEMRPLLGSHDRNSCYHVVPDETGVWEIRVSRLLSLKRDAEIDIFYRQRTLNTPCGEMPMIYSTRHLCTEDVQEVHRALPYLVRAMLETFPMLYERLKPFLNAAEATT